MGTATRLTSSKLGLSQPHLLSTLPQKPSPLPSAPVALTLRRCAQHVQYFRHFAADIWFPQQNPTVILEDNQPAINLTVAPQVTRKSRHIALKEHYILFLYKSQQITPKYVGTNDMIADGLTKSLAPTKFLWFRTQLLKNTPSNDQ